MRYFIFTVLACAIFSNSSVAQSRKFADGFNDAKLHLANHKIESALPVLEELWAYDSTNANISYLLGLCYVKTGTDIPKAIRVLEYSSRFFAKDYDASSHMERRSPEYVYYYLLIAYSMNLECKSALETLNQFYKIYSYEDEYYLIDGQKWVRECHMRKKDEEEEEPALAVKEEPKKEEPAPEPEPEVVVEEVKEEPPVEENPVAEEVAVVEEELTPEPPAPEPAPAPAPQFKDRLVLYSDVKNEISTKSINYTTLHSLYGVQVSALLNPQKTGQFENLKNVEVYIDQNGVFRYVIGRFTYRSQAERLLSHVRKAGHRDAFIVDVNSSKYVEEVVTLDNESIHGEIAGKVDFKVQIGAFRHQIPDSLALVYLQIDGIREYTHNDLTILTVGSFDNYDEARAMRDQVRSKWIKDAFVVSYNYDRKISLQDAKRHLAPPTASDEAEEEDTKKAKSSKKKKNKKGKNKKQSDANTSAKSSDL